MRCCSNAATRGCCCGARTPISLSQLASRRPLTTRSHLSSPPQALATRCCSNAATAACAWIAQSVCGARRIASAQCAVSLSLRCHAAHHTATQARNASTGARYCAGREDCICPMCRQHISPVMAAAPRRMPDVCPPLLFFPDTPLLPPLGWPRGHAAHAHLYTPPSHSYIHLRVRNPACQWPSCPAHHVFSLRTAALFTLLAPAALCSPSHPAQMVQLRLDTPRDAARQSGEASSHRIVLVVCAELPVEWLDTPRMGADRAPPRIDHGRQCRRV
jgi:hypothetical protein